MYRRKRFLAIIAVALLSLFIFNPLNVLAVDDSGLPSLKATINQLSEKVDSIITKVTSTNDSVVSLQEQVSVQQGQIDQLQEQIDDLKQQNSNPTPTAPVTISLASFSGVGYDGQTFPKSFLNNKTIVITDAANFSKKYTVMTDNAGNATITLPAGLYLFNFDPNKDEIGTIFFFMVSDKVPNSKIALVSSYYESFQIVTNMYGGSGLSPWAFSHDDGNYLGRF